MLSCANPMSLTSSGISDSSTPDAWKTEARKQNVIGSMYDPKTDIVKTDFYLTSVDRNHVYANVLTSLKVKFLLLCESSTIFCKLAATRQEIKGSERTTSGDRQ